MRVGVAPRADDEDDVRGLGERKRVDPGLPDVAPGAEGEGRGDGIPCGASVEVREFDGDVADAGGPLCDAQLAGTRGHITAILTAHMRDAGANPRLVRLLRALPRNCCHCHGPLFSFACCGQPCGIRRGGRGEQVARPSRGLHICAHGQEDALDRAVERESPLN